MFDTFEPFYIKNAELSPWIGYIVVGFLSRWQMPLLFFISGASTWYALGSRTSGQYVGERLKRLLIPFVFGTLVIVPPQMYLALLQRSSTSASCLEYYSQFFQLRPFDLPDYTGIGFTWAHLWFILNLLVMSLVVLPLFLYLRSRSGQNIVSRLASFFGKGRAILLLALPLPFLAELPNIDGKPVFIYLTVLIYGFVLASDATFHQAWIRNKEVALFLGIASMSSIYVVSLSGVQFADNSTEDIFFAFIRNFNLWFWLMAILGFGQKYLNADNRVLRYAREASYPFYVLHQTVIVVIGFYVVQWSFDVNVKYLVIVAASLVGTMVSYDVLVRRTNVTRWLFGMKSAKAGKHWQVADASFGGSVRGTELRE
ncbi:MAG: acyltransferase [Chloroflexi bacterium]|nr:acyltransferase [Chloroflexota bacterium]